MQKLQALIESTLLFGVLYLVYEIMYFGYMFVVRMGIIRSWQWVKVENYSHYNLDQASLYYVKDHPIEYTILCWLLIIGILAIAALVTKGQTLKDMSIRWLRPGDFLISFLMGLSLVFIINGILGIVIAVTELDLTYIPASMYESYSLIFLLITVGVIAPVFEELFFRGLILGRLLRAYGASLAVLISGIIFSISHLNLSQSLFVFPIGLLCGILVVHTKSVFSAVWLHIVYNVANIYLVKMSFFQYNSLQLLIMVVFGTGLLVFAMNQVKSVTPNT